MTTQRDERGDGYVPRGVSPRPTRAPQPGAHGVLGKELEEEVYSLFTAKTGTPRGGIRHLLPTTAQRVLDEGFAERSNEERTRAYDIVNREYMRGAPRQIRSSGAFLGGYGAGDVLAGFGARTVNRLAGRDVVLPPATGQGTVGAIASSFLIPDPRGIQEIAPWEMALIELGMPASGIASAARTMSQSTRAALTATQLNAPRYVQSAAARVAQMQREQRGGMSMRQARERKAALEGMGVNVEEELAQLQQVERSAAIETARRQAERAAKEAATSIRLGKSRPSVGRLGQTRVLAEETESAIAIQAQRASLAAGREVRTLEEAAATRVLEQESLMAATRLRAAEAGRAGGPPGRPRPTATGAGGEGVGPTPRTMLELNTMARGQAAMTPVQRAAMNAARKPIQEEHVQFRLPEEDLREYTRFLREHNTLWDRVDAVPGVRYAGKVLNPGASGEMTPIREIGRVRDVSREILEGQARRAATAWMDMAQPVFRFDHLVSGGVRLAPRYVATRVKAATGVVKDSNFGKMSDMIEHPERYQFTKEQTRLLRVASDTSTQMLRDSQTRVGADLMEAAGDYWERIVRKGPKGELPSRRPDFRKARSFADVDDLRGKGYDLIDDPEKVLAARWEAGARVYVNQWAKNEFAKLVPTPAQAARASMGPGLEESALTARRGRDAAKAAYLADKTPNNFLALQQTEAEYVMARHEFLVTKKAAMQPGLTEVTLGGRIVPYELRLEADRYLGGLLEPPRGAHWLDSHVQDSMHLIRTLTLSAEMSFSFIQGQQLFFRNTVAWWRAMRTGLFAIVDEPRGIIGRDWEVVQEGMRAGAISRPMEMLFAQRGLAGIPTRIPIAKEVFGRFNRAFEWFVFRGQLELYKAGRNPILKQMPKESEEAMRALTDLGSAIRRELGTESYAILGVGETQRTVEALLAFAPRFYRANAFILGQAFTSGSGGTEARRALGSMLAGGLALSYAAQWKLNGKGLNLTDPEAPDWLQVQVGKSNFNMFGPFYPLLRAVARTTLYMQQGDYQKSVNEWTRYARSKSSFPIRILNDMGKLMFADEFQDYEGNLIVKEGDSGWERAGKGAVYGLRGYGTPITYESIAQGLSEGRPESTLNFFGLQDRYSPWSEMDRHFRQQQDVNPEGSSLRDANYEQRLEMGRRYPALADKLEQQARGEFGRTGRARAEIEHEIYTQLQTAWADLSPKMQQGDEAAAFQFRDFWAEKMRELSNRRMQASKDFGTFSEDFDLDTVKDPLDKALFSYWALYKREIAEGGALRPGSRMVDAQALDRRLDELEASWTPEQRLYVETNRGPQDLPPELQDYDRLSRWQRKVGWHEYYRQTPEFVNEKPEWQALYEEAKMVQRESPVLYQQWKDELYQQWGKANADFKIAWISAMDGGVDAARRTLRAENPEQDYQLAFYFGSPPALLATQARLAAERPEARQLGVLLATAGAHIGQGHLDVMRGLGIFSLEQLAATPVATLAAQRGIGVKAARNYIGQAQRILAAMRERKAAA